MAGSKEAKPSKSEQDQIQYIEGEGCQVWRPQVGHTLLFGVRGVSTSTSKKVYKRLKDRFDGKLE